MIAALGRSMSGQNDLRDIGPEPHVLLPDSSWEVTATREKLARYGPDNLTLNNYGSIASSPLVLAEPSAGGEADQASPQRSWREVLESAQRALPETGHAQVHRPNPLSSGTGLAATITLYSAALGRDLDANTLTAPDAPKRLHDVEWSITAEERSDTALCALGQQVTESGATGADAVLVSEKAAADFNEGEALGERCPNKRGSASILRITYPQDGTVYLDHPFVEVRWRKEPANKARQIVIRKLHDFLIGGDAQAELRRAHLRDLDGNTASVPGTSPELPPKLEPGSVDVLALFNAFEDARRSARVLFLLDASSAMEEPFRGPGGTRMRVGTDAVAEMLQSVGDRDEIGVWDFAEHVGGAHRVQVPLGRWSGTVGGAHRQALTRAHLRALRGAGRPGRVFDTLDAAVGALRAADRSTADTRDAIVLVADASTTDSDGVQRLTDDLRATSEPIPVFVIAFATQACASAEWRDVVASTGGQCYKAASVSDVRDGLNQVTTALWGEGIE
jgi:hypothetical protein